MSNKVQINKQETDLMSEAMGITGVNGLFFSSDVRGSGCLGKGNPYFCDIKKRRTWNGG
ncbi:MAG: hypothetical protein WBI07_09330 [Mobilitalea sp.]